jgi:hypothetical protein
MQQHRKDRHKPHSRTVAVRSTSSLWNCIRSVDEHLVLRVKPILTAHHKSTSYRHICAKTEHYLDSTPDESAHSPKSCLWLMLATYFSSLCHVVRQVANLAVPKATPLDPAWSFRRGPPSHAHLASWMTEQDGKARTHGFLLLLVNYIKWSGKLE